jgi:ribosomal protein S6--L-glutamate ligase
MDALQRLAAAGTRVVNPPRSLEIAVDKYLASAVLQAAGLPVPRTIVCQTFEDAMSAFGVLGQDVVIKPLFGSEGRGITRVNDEAVAWRVCKTLTQIGAVLYLQEFIRHEGWDLRLLLIGDQFHAIRRRHSTDWRTNVSRGATAEPYHPDPALVDLARRAAVAVQAPLAGVDILLGPDGQPYVLEVNAVPGWRGLARALQIDIAARVLDWLRHKSLSG